MKTRHAKPELGNLRRGGRTHKKTTSPTGPALVLGLLVGLLHEAHDEVLPGTPLASLRLVTASTIENLNKVRYDLPWTLV